MEAINNLLKILSNATSNPVLFAAILLALFFTTGFFTVFFNKVKQMLRKKEAAINKERDRQRNLDELEATHSDAVRSVRDRIRKANDEKES